MEWLAVAEGEPAQPAGDGLVLPVLPMCGVPWPGHQVMLKITDPSHVRMHLDILESGSRRLVVPFCRTRQDGRVRMGEMPEEHRRVHSCGSLLYLTKLEDVRERSNGEYRFLATHEVRGRVSINRLLNPAVLFCDDEDAQFETEYPRGEVRILDDHDVEVHNEDGLRNLPDWEPTEEAWTELNGLSETLEEPRLHGSSAIQELGGSSWRATAVFELLTRKLRAHREHANTYGEVRKWIKEEQKAGRLPQSLPEQLNACKLGVPPVLVEKLKRAEKGRPELREEHWLPFLRILAAGDVNERAQLLRKMVCQEKEMARTAVMLKRMLAE